MEMNGRTGCAFHERVAVLSPPAREFHRALLRAFLALGHAPTASELPEAAQDVSGGVAALLEELVSHDVIQRDPRGAIRAAYPFSATPTPHQVQVAGYPLLYAMCAIDALGLPFMIGCPATITTHDPMDGTSIIIWVEPTTGDQIWVPNETVILADQRLEQPTIVADCCCPLINAFASYTHAERWRAAHPEAAVRLLTQEEASAEAQRLFGALFAEESLPNPQPSSGKDSVAWSDK